jgi:hypothetical protein
VQRTVFQPVAVAIFLMSALWNRRERRDLTMEVANQTLLNSKRSSEAPPDLPAKKWPRLLGALEGSRGTSARTAAN